MPTVSIVIPTRNRAHLLQSAIASALEQTFENLEVLISDNYSTDNTKDLVDSFNNSKLRYVRTDEPLAMPDSWEFAFRHAKGEYITYLCDDTYLFPDTVEIVMKYLDIYSVKLAVWNMCTYFAPDWMESMRKNLLYIPSTSFKPYLFSSEESLQKLFNLEPALAMPKFLNSICHRSLAQKVIKAQKHLFIPPAPDYSVAVGLLRTVEKYLFLDWPLYVDGKFPESIGAVSRFNWGKATEEYLKEFKENLEFTQMVDLDIPTVSVAIAQSLENAKRLYPNNIRYEINRVRMIRDSINDLMVHESHGTNVKQAWQVLDNYLSRQPSYLRRAAIKQKILSQIVLILKKVRNIPFWENLERLRGLHVYRGSKYGFNNIHECGKVAPTLVKRLAENRGITL